MIQIRNVRLDPGQSEETLREKAARALRLTENEITDVKIRRKSLDARKKNDIHYIYTVEIGVKGEETLTLSRAKNKDAAIAEHFEYVIPGIKTADHSDCPPTGGSLYSEKKRPVIVGFGPAGVFAALVLAEAGLRPLVLERGMDVKRRKEKVEAFWNGGFLDPECNVQFGEGGAGTFSDGKLNTGTHDERIEWVLAQFAAAGAPACICYDAKPHIGTDVLVEVVRNLRKRIIAAGGEVRFEHKLVGLEFESKEKSNELIKIEVQSSKGNYTLPCENLILAIGHSARDTFEMLAEAGIPMEPKPFSMGVRIENRQSTINDAQYGKQANIAENVENANAAGKNPPPAGLPSADAASTDTLPGLPGQLSTDTRSGLPGRLSTDTRPGLPPADYKLSCSLPNGGSAYTFCMCPGGQVVAAASETGGVVTNGMSLSARDGENANAALLVTLHPEDFPDKSVLGGMHWQREIERAAFQAGGADYKAPAQLVGDFLSGRASTGAGTVLPTYRPGVAWADLRTVLPQTIAETIAAALPLLDQKLRGFAAKDAVLTAPETRSSSPVRILRGEDRVSTGLTGLYPCGEGAGYAGGITSAAVDGMRCAEAVLDRIAQT